MGLKIINVDDQPIDFFDYLVIEGQISAIALWIFLQPDGSVLILSPIVRARNDPYFICLIIASSYWDDFIIGPLYSVANHHSSVSNSMSMSEVSPCL